MSAFAQQIGPRKPGVRYLDGYHGRVYKVVSIDILAHGWWMVVRRPDGSTTGHCTPWNPERDKVIS
jgi:hypothetical protein